MNQMNFRLWSFVLYHCNFWVHFEFSRRYEAERSGAPSLYGGSGSGWVKFNLARMS